MKILYLAELVVMGLLAAAAPSGFRLDEAGGIGGLPFGQSTTQIAGFEHQFHKQGKPRLLTQLYARVNDTVRLGGLGAPSSYWFRGGRFVGVDIAFFSNKLVAKAVEQLTIRYGPPQVDAQAKEYYWLGQNSFISLDVNRNGSGSLLMGSLSMFNELVEETPVRAQARQLLKWQPDSIGLTKQLRLRH